MICFRAVTYLILTLLSYYNGVNGIIEISTEARLDKLLVYITDNVPEADGDVLKNIQLIMSEASKALYKATNYMMNGKFGVSFGEVHIRIPETWNSAAEVLTWQQCVKSEFKVVTKPINGGTDKPFTKQLGKCGEHGDNSRFSDSFFVSGDSNNIKIKGKQVLREFIKLRYGVFDEVPLLNVLYNFDGRNIIQSSCPATIKWEVNKDHRQCSDKNVYCTYKIDPHQTHNYSVMFDIESPMSEYFCNDVSMPHNKYAQNLHNKKCKRQSISSVMLNHSDFKRKFNNIKYTEPVFRIVKAQSRKIVLLLDTSGSMYPVINATKKALQYFINYTIENDADIGIVVFGNEASIESKMLRVNAITRKELLTKIDSLLVWGATNMGDGLLKAVEVLGGDIRSKDKMYGTIILLSDGENNEETSINYQEAIISVIQKGIVTYTIAYGNISDPSLNALAKESGGMFIYAPVTSSESELFSKFVIRKSCDTSEKRLIKAMEGNIKIDPSNALVNFTYIDKYVGKDTLIDADFKEDVTGYTIRIVDPQGMRFDPESRSTSNNITTIIFKISGKPAPGMYKLEMIPIRNDRYKRSTFSVPLTFRISGTPKGVSYNPEGTISTTLIESVNGSSYVTATIDLSNVELKQFEKVHVSLTLKYPNNAVQKWVMTDNGFGDDSIEGDGIFTVTVYARSFNQTGFYRFQGNVTFVDAINKVIIQRTIEMESLRVKSVDTYPIPDKVPPATINDIYVVSTDIDLRRVTIRFIAPGDDSMIGRITNYDVRIKCDGVIIDDQFIEEVAPFEEIIKELDLYDLNITDTFSLSLRGVDLSDNAGIWSPWIQIQF